MGMMLIFHYINCLCEAVPSMSFIIQPVLWLWPAWVRARELQQQ